MIVPLFVGREKSVRALEQVTQSDTSILLATQKRASDDDPATNAIFEIGTLASVLQLLKQPFGGICAACLDEPDSLSDCWPIRTTNAGWSAADRPAHRLFVPPDKRSNDLVTWTEWQLVPMRHTEPPVYLYWRERFWVDDQRIYSLITAR
jgi:hypothetical protein